MIAALAIASACSSKPTLSPLPPSLVATGPALDVAVSVAASATMIYDLAFSADGKRILSVELQDRFELVSRDVAAPWTERARIDLGPADYDVDSLAISPTGLAWVASRDGTVRALDLDKKIVTTTWHLGAPATAVAVASGGRRVLTGTASGVLCVRRAEDGALVHCVVAHRGSLASIAVHSDAIATASWDGTVSVFQLPSMRIVAQTTVAGSANALSWSPDGTRLAIATAPQPPVRTPEVAEHERVTGYSSADDRAAVVLWQPATNRRVTLLGHHAAVTDVSWMGGNFHVVSTSWDGTVLLWSLRTGEISTVAARFPGIGRRLVSDSLGARTAAGGWGAASDAPALLFLDWLYPNLP